MKSTQHQAGGAAARAAGILCRDMDFWLYLDRRARAKFGASVPDGTHNEQDARDWICRACGVSSRREIDSNPRAVGRLRTIKMRFEQWRARQKQGAG